MQALCVSSVQRKKPSKKTIAKIIGIAAVLLLFFSVLFFLAHKKNKDLGITPDASSSSSESILNVSDTTDLYGDEDVDLVIFYGGKSYKAKKNVESFLFIGIDSFGEPQESESYINKDQADVLMLVVVDHDTKQYSILQINRDTMAEITIIGAAGDNLGTGVAQIAFSHTYGSGLNDSCEYTVQAVKTLLMDSAEIDHYISLNMDVIGILNDSVGGVTVKIPYDMTVLDPAMTEGAQLTLTAKQAEYFVRGRMGLDEPTNISRMERQITFLNTWKSLANKKMDEDPGFAINLIGDLSDYMVTDMDLSKLSDLASYLSEYESVGLIKLDGDSRKGEQYMEFYCYENSIKEAVLSLYYNEES